VLAGKGFQGQHEKFRRGPRQGLLSRRKYWNSHSRGAGPRQSLVLRYSLFLILKMEGKAILRWYLSNCERKYYRERKRPHHWDRERRARLEPRLGYSLGVRPKRSGSQKVVNVHRRVVLATLEPEGKGGITWPKLRCPIRQRKPPRCLRGGEKAKEYGKGNVKLNSG